MPRYLAAKAVEHATNLDWSRRKLAEFREKDLPHYKLLDRLEAQLADDAQTLRGIEIALSEPAMRWVAEKACFTLNANLRDLSEHYIAGLLQQGKEELRWRHLLLKTAHRIGLTWIEDILVRLDRDLSIIPARHRDHSIPVFFAPPNQHLSVLSLPGIFHEFGHCVVSKHREIVFALEATVAEHFESERHKLGPMLPAQRAKRLRQIDDAASYWDEHRLVEMFCDVFASYTCGAVNVLSMVDLSRANTMDPYAVDCDYPPHATRISVSYLALSEEQRKGAGVSEVWSDWQQMEARLPVTNEFKAFCPDALVARLAARSVDLIAQYQPGTPRQNIPPAPPDQALQAANAEDLCDAAMSGLTVIWHTPHLYDRWMAGFHTMLGFT
jgi:hypothetical protein